MALCDVHWISKTLVKAMGTYVILPEVGTPPFPTFYLLHGLSDDYTMWLRRTRIEMYVRELPLIVVMPDGLRGFYTNNEQGPAYAKYMAEDLPDFIERTFPAIPKRSARAIGGLSMGGYGALRLGLGYPDRYCSVTSHSGAFWAGQSQPDLLKHLEAELTLIFGKAPKGTDHDVVHLAKKAKAGGQLPKIRIDCGTEDYLININRSVHAEYTKMGIPHEYEEFPGAHNWDYWDIHIQEALRFHARNLKLTHPADAKPVIQGVPGAALRTGGKKVRA